MNWALLISSGEYIFNLVGDDCFYDAQVLSDWVAEFQKTGAQVITAYRAVCDHHLKTQLCLEPFENQVRSIKEKSPLELFEEIAKSTI